MKTEPNRNSGDKEQRARDDLAASECRFRELAENIREAFWVRSPQRDKLLYASPAYEKIWRRSCESLYEDPESWAEAIVPEDRSPVLDHIVERQLEGDYDVEYRILVDGVFTRWIHERAYPVTDAAGNVVRIVGIADDITLRKQAEESVRQLAAFPRLNPNPVMELQRGEIVSYWNDAAEEMTTTLGARKLTDILPENWGQIVDECLTTGQSKPRLESVRHQRALSCSFFPIAQLNVVHCYVSDITERRKLENQIRQSQKMETIGTLASGVAHDFNNLLTVIQGNASMLLSPDAATPDQREMIEDIAAAADRGASLTRQLLMFGRQQPLRVQPVDLSDQCHDLRKMLCRLLGETIEVQLSCPPDLPPVTADPGMVDQIILNLSVNARDAMPEGGLLRIAVQRARPNSATGPIQISPESHLCLVVADNGCGIPEEVLPRIFDPFFTTKEVGHGTGLGLATVHGIVSQHEGWIDVESRPDIGTAFRVYLPLAAPAPTEEPAPTTIPKTGNGQTILFVEDETSVRELGRKLLSLAGYEVLIAPDGPQAEEIFNEKFNDVDLLVSDVVMPGGMTGHQLAHRLTERKPTLPVLLISGYFQSEPDNAIEEQNYAFLPKPFINSALLKAVANSLGN